MVGLAGVIYSNSFQANSLCEKMLDSLSHRAETTRNFHAYKNLEMGVLGSKLVFNGKRNAWIVLDGQFVNLPHLIQTLKREGFPAQEKQPPEQTLLQLYECYGPNFPSHLEGAFAFALFDQRRNLLLLGRDPFGRRPLYWAQHRGTFIFGSELKTLLSTGLLPQSLAIDGLGSYLSLGYVPQDLCPVQGINKLLPGFTLKSNLDRRHYVQAYWSYSDLLMRDEEPSSAEELPEKLRSALENCLPLDERLAIIGDDLGAQVLCHETSKIFEQQHPTQLGLRFPEGSVSSRESLSKPSLLRHHIDVSVDDLLQDLVKMVWLMDEPQANAEMLATWQLLRLGTDRSNRILTPTGSVETFGASPLYCSQEDPGKGIIPRMSKTLRSLFVPILHYLSPSTEFRLMRQLGIPSSLKGHWEKIRLLSQKDFIQAAPIIHSSFPPEVLLGRFHRLPKLPSSLRKRMYFDVKTRLPDQSLAILDRFSKYHGVSLVFPYLMPSILQFSSRLPEEDLLRGSHWGCGMHKSLGMEGCSLQSSTLSQQIEDLLWSRSSHLIRLFSCLSDGALVSAELISAKWIKSQLNQLKSRRMVFPKLWAILILEIWYRLFIHFPLSSSPPNISVMDLLEARL